MPLSDEVSDDEACSVPLVAVRVALGAGEAECLNLSVCDLLVLCRRNKRELDAPQRGTGRHNADTALGCGLVGRVRLSAPQDEVFAQHRVHLVLTQTVRPYLIRDELFDEAVVVVLCLSACHEHGQAVVLYVDVGPARDLA